MKRNAIILAAVGVLMLTGCSTGTAAAGAPSGGSSPASGASTANAGKINVCALVPLAKASSVSGQDFSSAKPSTIAKGVYACSYGGDGYNWSIAIYQPGNGLTFDDLTGDLGGASNVKSVSGVGDKAVVSGVGVAAQFGNRMLEVGYPSTPDQTENRDAYIALAKAAIAALS